MCADMKQNVAPKSNMNDKLVAYAALGKSKYGVTPEDFLVK